MKIETSFGLSTDQAKIIIKENDYFDKYYNPSGKGIQHKYKKQKIKDDEVVIDEIVGLMWQQSGSLKEIEELNREGYAGFHDWRLPTIEEGMCLIEQEPKNDLYIDPVFDSKQRYIWTVDQLKGKLWAWVVFFYNGSSDIVSFDYKYYVRAVRSAQSS